MEKFIKLFEFDDIGQVAVMMDTDEDCNPAVKIFFTPPDLGVCCMKLGFQDTDDGWDKQEKAFLMIDSDGAYSAAKSQIDMVSGGKF
jgi:hypothetical protein